MVDNRANAAAQVENGSSRSRNRVGLNRSILACASRGLSRTDFLHAVSTALMSYSGCDAIEVRLSDGELCYRWETAQRPQTTRRFELMRWTRDADGSVLPATSEPSDLEQVCLQVARQQFALAPSCSTDNGSFWTGNAWERLAPADEPASETYPKAIYIGGHYRSLAIIRFLVNVSTVGLLLVKSERSDFFTTADVEALESIAQTLGLAVATWRAQHALRERVKELTCLYGITQLAETAEGSLEDLLPKIVDLLAPGWQYPEITTALITVDGRSYAKPDFRPGRYRQSAEIIVRGRRRGTVEIHYVDERPEFAAGAFLEEEYKLIAGIARELALIVERKDADSERENLQHQLIHADRLATIGQLAAGVAHELNEPLGSILGFAQLAHKCLDLPEAAARDIEKIITGSLYAREIVKKLMVFARQVPAKKHLVDLSQIVEDSLYFLEARCAKAGIRVVRELSSNMPLIHGDPAQIKQILVNIVVNAVQAMPDGGVLTVRTTPQESVAALTVEDTGMGMTQDVVEKIFLPFFTTKDVNEGTGLGLAVVHGIVSSHGGSIDVQSRPGHGTRFEIRLPVPPAVQVQETGQHGDGA